MVVETELDDGVMLTLSCGHPGPTDLLVGGEADCDSCDRRRMPPTVQPGRKTPVFDKATVPPGLLRAHQTNAWAELVVLDGIVEFVDEEPPWTTLVRAGDRVVIVPQRAHHIVPSVDAQLYVQFYD